MSTPCAPLGPSAACALTRVWLPWQGKYADKGTLDGIDEQGHTALMIGASLGYFQIVEALIEVGCDLKVVDAAGNDAEAIATQNGHVACADLIRQHVAQRAALEKVIFGDAAPAALVSDSESVMDKMLRGARAQPVQEWHPPCAYPRALD